MTKKALIIRYGAFGDNLMITPVIRKLKELGYRVVVNTNKRGIDTFLHNPYIDEYIKHDEEMPVDQLPKHWEELKKTCTGEDKFINFSESIECHVALHPIQPAYNYTKPERVAICNRNYYDVTAEWAGLTGLLGLKRIPELYFTAEEISEAQKYIRADRINILWQLSGSGKQKVYPWTDYVIGEALKEFSNLHFITTGDEKCQLLESIEDPDITNLSGRVPVRIAMALTGLVDLVISPDTGILHAAGCYPTPKIGLLGHTTKENITKYFINDYSLEAICPCAPCMRLIYDYDIQCPVDIITRAAWCMAIGLPPERVYKRIIEVIGNHAKKR